MSRILLTMTLAFLIPFPNEASGQHHTVRFLHSWGGAKDIEDVAFSPDGKYLAVAVEYGPLTIIETSTGDIAHEFKVAPFDIAFSADGGHLLGIGQRETSLVNVRSRSISNVNWRVPEGYVGCTFKEKSGKLVVDSVWDGGPAAASAKIGKGDEIIAITSIGVKYELLGRSVKNLVEPLSGPPGSSVTLHMIPKGTTVPVDIELRRKGATKNGDQYMFQEFRGGRSAQTCFCATASNYVLLDANTGHLVSVFRPLDCKLNGPNAVSPDGRHFALAANLVDPTKGGSTGLALEVYDVATQERTHFATLDVQTIHELRFTPDSGKILIGDRDRIAVYDLQTDRFAEPVLIGFNPHEAEKPEAWENSLAGSIFGPHSDDSRISRVQASETLLTSFDISTDGTMVAVGSPYGQCSIYSTTENKCLATIGARNEDRDSAEKTTFSPDGRWVSFFVDGTMNIVSVPEVISVPESVEADLASQE